MIATAVNLDRPSIPGMVIASSLDTSKTFLSIPGSVVFVQAATLPGRSRVLVRLNIEDTTWKHIPRLAKEMRWSEREAAGALFRFWRDTQEQEIVTAPRSLVASACALGFESDEEIDQFLTALIKAQLATEDESGYSIRGNGDHVLRLVDYRARASKGGIAKNKKRNDSVASKQAPAKPQASPPLSPGVPSYAPMLLCSLQEENTNTGILLVPQEAEASPSTKRGRSPAEQARARLVKQAFHAGYLEFYGRPIDRWGAPENSHIYHLLKSSSAEVLAAKAGAYFKWANKKAIDAGHPFMNHNASFSMNLSELTADEVAPERRQQSAKIKARMEMRDDVAISDDGLGRLDEFTRLYAERDPFDASQWTSMGGSRPGPETAITTGDRKPVRELREASQRSLALDVVSSTGAVRQGGHDLAAARSGVSGTLDAGAGGPDQGHGRQAGNGSLQADPGTLTGTKAPF